MAERLYTVASDSLRTKEGSEVASTDTPGRESLRINLKFRNGRRA
ncbi:MAG: hypothetical protein P1U68_17660 [Verrucomicrobiales bacterium]|nr:hypothetical protein [Verrucomicrobiales bacterium]